MIKLARDSRVRQIVRQAGAWRLARTFVFIVLAILFARLAWSLPLAIDAERALYDVRLLVTAPVVAQDDRIVMVVYTDETLEATGKRSPLDRSLLARALTNLDKLGAKAIGIDMLIDQSQPEDRELIAAFRGMRTPVKLAFASNATNSVFVQPWQEAFMQRFHASLKPGNVSKASIRIEADPDGVMRSWPDRPPELPPLLPDAVAPGHPGFDSYQGSLLYRQPKSSERPVFASLPIDLFGDAATAGFLRNQIAGRYVMIGGDISDVDQFDTPATRLTGRTTSGLEIHATMLAQLLDNRLPWSMPNWVLWLAAVVVVGFGVLAGVLDFGPWRTAALIIQSAALILGLPFLLQWLGVDTQKLPMFGWLGGWLLAYIATSAAAAGVGSEQRVFAQSALGKYLPRDVAKEILRDPDNLALHGERREIYALFTDLEGFTKLSHRIEPEMVATLLNRYLDLLSETVLRHGGTLDKFVGDAVIAFWGAPLSRPDDADRAVKAAIALYEAGERFRREAPEGVPAIGRTRVGLHRGDAIVGNFGGEGRIQYTALGDSMNTASRLESANKSLETTLLVSKAAAERSTLDCFRPMGRVLVRGRSTPIEIFEAKPGFSQADIAAQGALLERFDAGDTAALDELRRFGAAHADDAALANLVYRLETTGPGGSYVLE